MLRSLVGSEMCIRDSLKGAPVFARGECLDEFRRLKNYKPSRFKAPGSICLLYTSDAADDLLCVDLGGRRIIKKKNTS